MSVSSLPRRRSARRTACVDLPALPLQVLLRREPSFRGKPAAVVADERPLSRVLWINDAARAGGVRTGMRYGAALSLAPTLRAGAVKDAEIDDAVASLVERLQRFTPGVEPLAGEPGVFLLDAAGLTLLHGTPAAWARAIRADLADAGFVSRVAVGFSRFGAYAAARVARDLVVFAAPDEEDAAAARVPLARLGVDPSLRDSLERLGVRTAGDLRRLPEGGVLARFGDEAKRLHALAAGTSAPPLTRAPHVDPLDETAAFESAETDGARLFHAVERLLRRLLRRAAARDESIAGLTLRLALDRGSPSTHELRPASPTSDEAQLLDLLRIRLASLRLATGVTEATLTAHGVRAGEAQLGLFVERPRRDPAAAERAFARLRAEFGDDAVVVARPRDEHLPEERFAWEALRRAAKAAPRPTDDVAPLVRRHFAAPRPLARLVCPRTFRFASAWWRPTAVEREYGVVLLPEGLASVWTDPRSGASWLAAVWE